MKTIKILIMLILINMCCYAQNWFPAEVGNKTLEKCTIFEQLWGNVRNFFLVSIVKDTIIEDQKYYLVQNWNYIKSELYEEKWFRYDSDSQKIYWRILDTSVVLMDFNIPPGGQLAQYNPVSNYTSYKTVFESTISLFGNTYTTKGFNDGPFSVRMREWIDGFGIKPQGINNPRIEQVLQYHNNDTVYLEYGYGPYFDSLSPVLDTNLFNFNFDFNVDHFYTYNPPGIWVDFIDSVYIDCYYKSDTDSIPADRLYSYKVYFDYYGYRRVNFNIDSSLIQNGYSFFYKVTAKDKGLIPKYASSPETGYYELKFTTTEVSDNTMLSNFSLSQNHPNPFNPTTTIKYAVGTRQLATIKVYDVLGNEVATLVNEEKQPGVYEVEFQSSVGGKPLASGIYYYLLKAGNFVETKKMILIK